MNHMIDGDLGYDPRSPYYTGKEPNYELPITYGYIETIPCPGNHELDEQYCQECMDELYYKNK